MTITRIQKQFPLSVFVFIDSSVVSAAQDAGGYAISHQNILELHLGCHTCWSSYFTLVFLWCGRTVVITKISRMGRLPNFLTHGVPLRARGAPLLNAMTDLIHSQLRLGTNEKRTVAIIYKLCYGLSQVCNWLQTDHALFLKDSNLNQRGLEAQREMGNSCCRRRVIIIPAELAESNTNKIGELISETINEKWQLALIIDDYTSIHSKRRQKTDQLCHPKSMCPIVDKVFKNVKAIPRCSATTYHN